MFTSKLDLFLSHKKQYIPNLRSVQLSDPYRGRPNIGNNIPTNDALLLQEMCPVNAITATPFTLNLGRCIFCGECAQRFPKHISFTTDYRLATNNLDNLVITSKSDGKIELDPDKIRPIIKQVFGQSLRLRQVSAGGDNSTEMELNASMNVNFDLGRYGIEFVASPRHADGLVITGPISENMAVPLEICYNAIANPKIIILAGSDAISGGIFAQSDALNRSFLNRFNVDLYIPGNPTHPLSFINGVLDLIGYK